MQLSATQVTADEVRAARFQTTKFREGYDQAQVDALLERSATALDVAATGGVPELAAPDVLDAKFTATKFRPGYDQDEVDDFLDRVVATLRSVAGLGRDGRPVQPIDAAGLRAELAALQPRRLRSGYDPAAVTELLTAASHALELRARGLRPSPSADAVAGARFGPTWWSPGFERHAVDALLERVATSLRD